MFPRAIASFVVLAVAIAAPLALGDDSNADRLLHFGLQPVVDDEARLQLSTADDELARGDVATALARWKSILELDRPGSLIPVDDRSVSPRTHIVFRLSQQPQAVRNEFQNLLEPSAQRALAAAADEPKRLLAVARRYPGTRSTREALERLAGLSFDAGEFATCRQAVDDWLIEADDPRESVAKNPVMIVWRTLSARALWGDQPDRIWQTYAGLVPVDLKSIVETATFTAVAPVPGSTAPATAPGMSLDVGDVLPSPEAIWQVSLGQQDWQPVWTSMLHDFEEFAHPLPSINQPAVVDAGLVLRGRTSRMVRLEDGLAAWTAREPLGSPLNLRTVAVEQLRLALGESSGALPTISGGLLIAIERSLDAMPPAGLSNELVVRSLSTGDVEWRLSTFPVGNEAEAQPVFFLGPPAVLGGLLVTAFQHEERISVAAVELKTGQVRWQTRLGDAGLPLAADSRRRWMPAVLMIENGRVLCATGNGALACLDPTDGRVHWVSRADREDWRGAGPPLGNLLPQVPRFRMWTGWREPIVAQFGNVIVWAGPETNRCVGIDARSGRRIWNRPRGEGLFAMADAERVVIVSPDRVTRLNPQDGTELWTATIECPAGKGFLAGGWCVVPLRSGGAAAVGLKNGSVVRSVAWDREITKSAGGGDAARRTLTWTPQGIVEQSLQSVGLFRPVARGLADPASPSALAAAGKLSAAMEGMAPSMEKSRLRALELPDPKSRGRIVTAPAEKLVRERLSPDVEQRLLDYLEAPTPAQALSVLENVPLPQLREAWLEFGNRRVRADLELVASLLEASDGRSSPRTIRAEIVVRLDELADRLDSTDPDSGRELIRLLVGTSWGAQRLLARIQQAQTWPTARAQARDRLSLLTVATLHGDLRSQAEALLKLVTPRPPEVPAWPDREPRFAGTRPWPWTADTKPIEVIDAEPRDLAGLNVEIKLKADEKNSGVGLRLSGVGEDRPWAAPMPPMKRPLEQSVDFRSATLMGPLTLLHLGVGLFGVLPFDQHGERDVAFAWDVPWIDMWSTVSPQHVAYLPRLSDLAVGRHPLDLDDFGRPLTQIGPVTSSWFCYRQFDRLVVCDTQTGRQLWSRRPFDPDAVATGDLNGLMVVSPTRDLVETLDPLDGRLLDARPFGFASKHWNGACGGLAIVRTGRPEAPGIPATEPSTLAAIDLRTGQPRWREPIAEGAVDFRIGDRLIGTVEPGRLRLLDLATGQERLKVGLDLPDEISAVHVVDDPWALMIGVFGPVSVEQLRPPLMHVGSRRRPFANGVVVGLDPESFVTRWTLPLERSVFPLDQPRDLPLLVIADAVLKGANGIDFEEGRVRCFDKRTGRQIGPDLMTGSAHTGMTIERSQREGWIDIRTKSSIHRFDFESPASVR